MIIELLEKAGLVAEKSYNTAEVIIRNKNNAEICRLKGGELYKCDTPEKTLEYILKVLPRNYSKLIDEFLKQQSKS